MSVLKCKMCGANLNPKEGETICECEYCGSRQTVSTSNDERVLKIISRGTLLRSRCEFDKAYNLFNQLVVDGAADAETYWNIVLCKYGITYVDDYDGSKKPTINRISTVYIKDDDDFKKALDLADPIAKQQYINEADAIQNIQKGILDIVNKEEPYDIFISYKETDEFGERTEDSVLAQDIYNQLTDEGYRVFLSRVSLSSIAGQGYEPYIYSALFTSKAMILVGTDEEYLNAVWVKNEWSRFLNMMLKDKNKKLIPCFKSIDAYDLPKEIQSFQGIDFDKLGAMQDLVIGVNKIFGKSKARAREVAAPTINLEPQFKRLNEALTLKKWTNADVICDTILTLDPNNSKAYFDKFLVENECSDKEEFLNKLMLVDNKNFTSALNLANAEEKKEYNQFLLNVKSNIKNKAHDLADRGDFDNAIELLKIINEEKLDQYVLNLIKEELEHNLEACLENTSEKINVLQRHMELYKEVINENDKDSYNQKRLDLIRTVLNEQLNACGENAYAKINVIRQHLQTYENVITEQDKQKYTNNLIVLSRDHLKQRLDYYQGSLFDEIKVLEEHLQTYDDILSDEEKEGYKKELLKKKIEFSYETAVKKIENGNLNTAIDLLNEIQDYEPAKKLIEKAKKELIEKNYNDAVKALENLSNDKDITPSETKNILLSAKEKLEQIGTYKDSSLLLDKINNFELYKIVNQIQAKMDLFEINGVKELLEQVKGCQKYDELCRYFDRVLKVNDLLDRISAVRSGKSNEDYDELVNKIKTEYGDMNKIDRILSLYCQPIVKKKKGFSFFHRK